MSRFSDDIHTWSREEDAPPPVFVNSLLRRVGLTSRTPRAEQELAISKWLETHSALPVLRDDLHRKGFGNLLAEHKITA